MKKCSPDKAALQFSNHGHLSCQVILARAAQLLNAEQANSEA